jgi:ABC-type histidine transport system ATPase subunit
MIELVDVTKTYGEADVLKGVTLKLIVAVTATKIVERALIIGFRPTFAMP